MPRNNRKLCYTFVVFAFLNAFFAPVARAAWIDGAKLATWADSSDKLSAGAATTDDAFNAAMFIGYVAGSLDSPAILNNTCMSDQVTAGQAQAIVKKYLRANPEKWTWSGSAIIYLALTSAFPCQHAHIK